MAKEKITILHRWFDEVWNYPWSVPDCSRVLTCENQLMLTALIDAYPSESLQELGFNIRRAS